MFTFKYTRWWYLVEYMTVICDLKDSKQLADRESVQYRLIDALKEANANFASVLAAPFIITIGDEWQGLLAYPCDYKSVLDFFCGKLAGLEFYTGVGIGEVTIHNFELTVNQLDGPSFYKARMAIKIAKRMKFSLVYIH